MISGGIDLINSLNIRREIWWWSLGILAKWGKTDFRIKFSQIRQYFHFGSKSWLSAISVVWIVWKIAHVRFFVRSKSDTFLEPLRFYKKTAHTVQFFVGHFVDFQDQNMMMSDSMVSQKSTFPKWNLYIIRKIIQYWSFFPIRLGCQLLSFLS